MKEKKKTASIYEKGKIGAPVDAPLYSTIRSLEDERMHDSIREV